MKATKINLPYIALLLFCMTSIAACTRKEKTTPERQKELLGSWQETAAVIRILTFKENGDFLMSLRSGNESTVNLYGTYKVKGDSLKLNVDRQEEVIPNQPTIITLINHNFLNEDCVYKVKDNTLDLTYITYPADAPVRTESKFTRQTGLLHN